MTLLVGPNTYFANSWNTLLDDMNGPSSNHPANVNHLLRRSTGRTTISPLPPLTSITAFVTRWFHDGAWCVMRDGISKSVLSPHSSSGLAQIVVKNPDAMSTSFRRAETSRFHNDSVSQLLHAAENKL